MSSFISVQNLSKRYFLGSQQKREKYTALRDVITKNARDMIGSTKSLLLGRHVSQKEEPEQFWALRDVSFELNQGEVLGIIGRNGAGKSTLLKLLSRITEPTNGRIEMHGRVASLLEVGTGFHPELTGRENVFLNGAILGMSRAEIRRKFDEIVAFAEVERFLDTPVKRYSSGMYVRLAFAVAAHLEPEILIVDEVLAVGDASFQKKCMGKMKDVGKSGRTVLFVSHNMEAVMRLCSSALYLEKGAFKGLGKTPDMIKSYLDHGTGQASEIDLSLHPRVFKEDGARFQKVRVVSGGQSESAWSFYYDEPISFKVEFIVYKRLEDVDLAFQIFNSGIQIVSAGLLQATSRTVNLPPGKHIIDVTIKEPPLNPGTYTLGLSLVSGTTQIDNISDVVQFDMMPSSASVEKNLHRIWAPITAVASMKISFNCSL
jgi:lipopolysaccharide transport system ATP-binding protein